MSALKLRWRFFWSKRSRSRKVAALLAVLLAVFAMVYLALPMSSRQFIADVTTSIAQVLATLDLRTTLILGAGFLVVISIALIGIPSYRKHPYLTTEPSLIPKISVYLDAENQLLAELDIRPFTIFLREHLDGRSADLLYFMDASHDARSERYKLFYRFGFRLIDVPHNPTGEGPVKEAVDRELAMHAFERGLLGPKDQEFIIVTADRDFVPLVYRLAALGHHVQVWATPLVEAYRTLETYLDQVTVLDLSQVVSERSISLLQADKPMPSQLPTTKKATLQRSNGRNYRKKPRKKVKKTLPPPMTPFSSSEEDKLYHTIVETILASQEIRKRFHTDKQRNQSFHDTLGSSLGPSLASVGYSIGDRREFWLEHLATLHVFEQVDGLLFPELGATAAEYAARQMFAMAQVAARKTKEIASTQQDGVVRMDAAATALDTESSDGVAIPPLLLPLFTINNDRRSVHARYFVRCARALGLIAFEDVPESVDIIRVLQTQPVNISATTGDNEAPPTFGPTDGLHT